MANIKLDDVYALCQQIDQKCQAIIATQALHTSALATIDGKLTALEVTGSFSSEDREALMEALEILKQSEEPDYV